MPDDEADAFAATLRRQGLSRAIHVLALGLGVASIVAAPFSARASFGIVGGVAVAVAGGAAMVGGVSVIRPKGWGVLARAEQDRGALPMARGLGALQLLVGAGVVAFFAWARATGLGPF